MLGMAASVAVVSSAHAQGRVFFASYNYSTAAQIVYGAGAGGTVGAGVNNTFTAGLWYFLGTTTLAAGGGPNMTLPTGWEQSSVTAQLSTAAPTGYFNGPIANISDYVSGPITFSIIAYNGTALNSATTTAQGNEAGFTLSSIASGVSPTGEFGAGATGFSVLPVPEPSVIALSGLGAAALMAMRRKK